MAKGKLGVEYTAHPGTPLQIIIACSARMTHIFQGEKYFLKDFIDHPEKYIHNAHLLLLLLIGIAFYALGSYTYKLTNNLFTALLLQTGVFIHASLFDISARLMPETLLLIPLTGITILVLRHSMNHVHNTQKEYLLFALTIGFGIACKLSFAPFIFLPLLLISSPWKQKVRFLLFTILFFTLFAYPILVNFNKFWHWTTNMLVHSGKWGAGDKNFMNWSSIPQHFRALLHHNPLFYMVYFIGLVLSLVALTLPHFNWNKKAARSMLSLATVLALIFGLTLKHFSLHYFMPFYLLEATFILLTYLLIKPLLRTLKWQKLLSLAFLLITWSLAVQGAKGVQKLNNKLLTQQTVRQESADTILALLQEDAPIIYTGPYYGTPLPAFAQSSGFMMTSKYRPLFKNLLKEKYAQFFHYVNWSEHFYYWDDYVDINFIDSITTEFFYVYIGRNKQKDLQKIESRIYNFYSDSTISKTSLYANTKTGEQLLQYKRHESDLTLP